MNAKSINMLIKNYKSIYFNFKVFDFKTAIRFPVLISNNVKCIGLKKGVITLSEAPYFGMVKLGTDEGSSGIWKYDRCHGVIDFTDGNVVFGKHINFARGFSLKCINGGYLNIGNNFFGNCYISILASKKIIIGNDCLFGYNVFLNCSDGHKIISTVTNQVTNENKDIIIGNHVWLCANVSALKGTKVNNNSIVGYNAVIGKEFTESNCCIVGPYPGHIVKRDINWAE